MAHFSPAAFVRSVLREVGKSSTTCLNDARCGWAALRLIQGREPTALTAQGCGIQRCPTSTIIFGGAVGMAHRDFRAGRIDQEARAGPARTALEQLPKKPLL